MGVFVVIKEFIEGLEELLLVSFAQRGEEGGVVGFLFLLYEAGTYFVLAVVGRFVTLLLVSPPERSGTNIVLVYPRGIYAVAGGNHLGGGKEV